MTFLHKANHLKKVVIIFFVISLSLIYLTGSTDLYYTHPIEISFIQALITTLLFLSSHQYSTSANSFIYKKFLSKVGLISRQSISTLLGDTVSIKKTLDEYTTSCESVLNTQQKEMSNTSLGIHLSTQQNTMRCLLRYSVFVEHSLLKLPVNRTDYSKTLPSFSYYLAQTSFGPCINFIDSLLNRISLQRKKTVFMMINQHCCINKRLDEHREDIEFIHKNFPEVFNDPLVINTFTKLDKYLHNLTLYLQAEGVQKNKSIETTFYYALLIKGLMNKTQRLKDR